MLIEVLYILDCPWCKKTKKLVRASLKELAVKATLKEVLIDSDKKARQCHFVGSPTVRIDGKDIQAQASKGKCLPCEEMAGDCSETTEFVKKECGCGCRTYFYKGKQHPFPPKEMIKEAIKKLLENRFIKKPFFLAEKSLGKNSLRQSLFADAKSLGKKSLRKKKVAIHKLYMPQETC